MISTGAASTIDRIADRDAMYHGNDDHYFRVGRSASTCIEMAMTLADLRRDHVGRILDLACGHGRVMRALRATFPDAEITGCDVDRDGVEFCAETFGAVPIVSDPDPRRIALDGRFDLIWCGSLLTHVPLESFGSLLALIAGSLSDNGVAVVTTHGRRVATRIDRQIDDYGLGPDVAGRLALEARWQGFAYADYSDQADYGISLCAPGWLMDYVTEALPTTLILAFMESAWDDHQDVLMLARRSSL